MSKPLYVADSHAVIALSGLRMAEKADRTQFGGDFYNLKLDYKGLQREVNYTSKSERDQTFDQIRTALARVPASSPDGGEQ